MDFSKDKAAKYWDTQYEAGTIAWDLGAISTPLKEYIDQLTDKEIRILIPGAGNSYEAEYLAKQGFKHISIVDISEKVCQDLSIKFKDLPQITISNIDFFKHEGQYDLIFEQTFFCALDPSLRENYVEKMHSLLHAKGRLVGLLFDRIFEKAGPPFGGTKLMYEELFNKFFSLKTFALCYNSVKPRLGTELFINITPL